MEQACQVLVRFHEIALKGKNRPMFIKALVANIRRATQGMDVERVWASHMVVRLTLATNADWDAIRHRLATVSGIAKFSLAYEVAHDFAAIQQQVLAIAASRTFDSFRITAHRADKRFSLTSKELNIRLGDAVALKSRAKVDLRNPEVDIRVEVLPEGVFIHDQEEPGPGGLPVGTSGHIVTLMSGGSDSPGAAWRMVHRGCTTSLVHFHSFPLVEGRSREKARELAEILTTYQYRTRLHLVPFAPLQQHLILSIPGPLRIVVYRRFMLRIAEAIARKERAGMLVTGESLGQVGSQTLSNMTTIGEAVQMPLLRPLVGMDKQEIVAQAQTIGTYETSIMPDEDCCSLFVPRSPATRTYLKQIRSLESGLDVAGLVDEAVAGTELVEFRTERATANAS